MTSEAEQLGRHFAAVGPRTPQHPHQHGVGSIQHGLEPIGPRGLADELLLSHLEEHVVADAWGDRGWRLDSERQERQD
jgi:hypothetical protein